MNNLSEEEKEAIEGLKEINQAIKYRPNFLIPSDTKLFDTILKIFEKQQKEIKELSAKLTTKICKGVEEEVLEEYRQEIEYLKRQIPQDKIFYYSEKDYISKDKIREILNKYGKKEIEYAVDFYKEIEKLLEE